MFVDDEENILNSLVRLFKNDDFRIFTALSPTIAMTILKEHDVSLVISDYKMPGMNGVEFLEKVREEAPDTLRIMLTGYADMEAAVSAINKGEVYRFITKPWNDEELLVTVKQSLDYRDLTLKNKHLTRTVKKQAQVLQRLETGYPGISEVARSGNGAIVVEEETDNLFQEYFVDGAEV